MSTHSKPLVLSDEPFATPTRIDLPDGVAVVQLHRSGVSVADLPGIFDAGYTVLAGLGPIGPGYAIYRGDVSATFDVTIGFPVASVGTELPEGVELSTFASGPAWVQSHRGSFDGLGASWDAFVEQADGAGAGVQIEVYVTDPSQTAVEDLRTDLILPVA